MGGCKCSFRDCRNSTERMPGMSFFHYPFKEPTRFAEWLAYTQKPEFKNLDLKSIRNKVVCSDHFRHEHFMNYQKNKLTKTASPTLGRSPFDRFLVLDYESSPNPIARKLPRPTLPHLIPPPHYEIPAWSPEYNVNESGGEETEEQKQAAEQKKKEEELFNLLLDTYDLQGISVDRVESPKKTYNKTTKQVFADTYDASVIPEEFSSPERTIDESPVRILGESLIKPHGESLIKQQAPVRTIGKSSISHSSSKETPQPATKKRKVVIIKNKLLNNLAPTTAKPEEIFRIPVTEILNSSDDISYFQDKATLREIQTQTTPHSLPDHDKLLMKQKLEYEAKIRELEAALERKDTDLTVLKLRSDESASKLHKLESYIKDSVSSKPPTLSKAQLYNGLKKYLCPAMATLVRMDMFGGAEREWKKDEKMASIDLWRLGDGVFNYFRDEWRIHLPAKKDVKEWAKNADQFEDAEL